MKQWLVGTDNGMLLVNNTEFTTDISKATRFDKIGDAMRECIRLNNIELGLTSKFKVIPLIVTSDIGRFVKIGKDICKEKFLL